VAVNSAAATVRSYTLVGQPDILWRLSFLPEHINRNAAAGIPIAADADITRLYKLLNGSADFRTDANVGNWLVSTSGSTVEINNVFVGRIGG
jgi:hypothetical protein